MKFDAINHQASFDDLTENRLHIFSQQHAKNEGFYLNEFLSHHELDIFDMACVEWQITLYTF